MMLIADEPAPRVAGSQVLIDRVTELGIAPRSAAFRWTLAAVIAGAAIAGRFAVDRYLPTDFPFLTFYPAVLFTAYFAGVAEGAVVTALCMVVARFAFMPPHHSFALDAAHVVALLLFLLIAGSELVLVHLVQRALRRLARAEAHAKEMARSRTLMFSELQHRVSNNLAVVGSLLSLQRREVSDPVAARALDAAAARVGVVSRLSRLLHDPEGQDVDFGQFLRAMVPDAVEAAGLGDWVEVVLEAEPVVVPAAKAVPLGLVTAELLANALEHGFGDGRRGQVRIGLDRPDEGLARITIRDDGAGLPEGFDLERTRSLGLMIARQFAEQIGARLSVREDAGVVSRVEVPLAG